MGNRSIQNHPYAVAKATWHDKSHDAPDAFETFVAISVTLTGFSNAELQSTGLMRGWFDDLALIMGRPIRDACLAAIAVDPAAALTRQPFAPLARNLIRMWYVGQWKALPANWAHANFDADAARQFNEFGRDADRVISPAGYVEGLAWRAIGINPPGAKQPGFASWTKAL